MKKVTEADALKIRKELEFTKNDGLDDIRKKTWDHITESMVNRHVQILTDRNNR